MAMIAALVAGIAGTAISSGIGIANAVTTANNSNPTNQAQASLKSNLDYMSAMDNELKSRGMPSGIPYLQGAIRPGYRAIKGTNYGFSNYQGMAQNQNPKFTSPLAFAQGLQEFSKYGELGSTAPAIMETAL